VSPTSPAGAERRFLFCLFARKVPFLRTLFVRSSLTLVGIAISVFQQDMYVGSRKRSPRAIKRTPGS